MDAKKLQALQQQSGAQKKFPLAYQTNINDYHTNSVIFQQQQKHTAPHQLSGYQLQAFQQSPSITSSSGPMTPIDMQPQSNKNLMLKHALGGGSNISSSTHSSPYHQSYSGSSGVAVSGNDIYQSPTERTYLTASGRVNNPSTSLQQQYQQLQQAKFQMQMQTQNEAMQQQQRTFALRQAMNPPVQQGHYHMSQSSSIVSTMTLQQQQQQQQQHQNHQGQQAKEQQSQQAQQQQRAPPSSLNLSSQFQPAPGPLKVQQQQQKSQQHNYLMQKQHQQQQQSTQDAQNIYGQHQQQFPIHHKQHLQHQQQQDTQQHSQYSKGNEQSPIYIQQNHPGHVVNQACQTQISAVKPHLSAVATNNQKATPSSEESSIKSPTHAPLDRKKSAGSIQAIKSPIAKRPPSSPVTLSGWLYKQGSDGLKVWRKRWFVLAEYCLYYYKGPEEEKLLGSILLPSYRVSACLPEDKIYRKFAFKCEHQNMRTYWLAAETGEYMVQWVQSLTAATMMQAPSSSGESDQTFQPSGSSSLNHSGENSDSGIHTIKSQLSKGQVTPASENGGTLSNNMITNGVGVNEGTQPLYANAPPKPRRFNDGGYSSPSPEHSIDNERKYQQQLQQMNRRSGIMSPTLQQMQQQNYLKQQQQQQQQCRGPQAQQHHAIYDTRTGNVSTALRLQQAQQQYSIDKLEADLQQQLTLQNEIEDFSKSPPAPAPASTTTSSTAYNSFMDMEEQIMRLQQQQKPLPVMEDIYGERELSMQKLIQQRYPGHIGMHPNMERRTPDAYGRSKNNFFSDYEDIYNMTQNGQHVPLLEGGGPTSAQAALLQEAASYRRPLSPPSYDNSKHLPPFPIHYAAQHLETQTSRARPLASIMRPHSADFLDYEARAEAAAAAVEGGISAALIDVHSPNLKSDIGRAPRPKSSLDINRTADSLYYSEASYAEKMRKSALYLQSPGQSFTPPLVNSGMNTIGYENPYERAYKRQELLSEMSVGDVQSVPRISRSFGGVNIAQARLTSARSQVATQLQHHQQQQVVQQHPPAQLQAPALSPSLTTQQIIQQNDQFLRSASARLPKRSGGFEDEYISSSSMTNTVSNSTTMPAVSRPHVSSSSSVTNGGSSTIISAQPQDGEKKREESMKRLLEWKQRMLQSPLTRKGNANTNKMSSLSKLGSNPNILLSSTTVASGAYYNQTLTNTDNLENSEKTTTTDKNNVAVTSVSGIQRSRSETQANANYNSYSSDDEDWDCMQAPAGRSTVNTSSSKTLTSTSVITSSSSGSKKHNTTIPTIAFIGMPTTTTIKPKLTQISEPLTKANAVAATNIQSASLDEALKTPIILKSILKTNESFHTQNPKNQKIIAKTKLHLNVSKSTKINELQKEVVIKPKKPAPKSPQNPSYIPVYVPKLLTSGSPVKSNEDGEESVDNQIVGVELESLATEKDTRTRESKSTEENSTETSILANLIVYKEVQASVKTSTNISTISDTVDSSVEEIRPSIGAEQKSESDGSETACEDYSDNQLDEFLALEAASVMSVNNICSEIKKHCDDNKKDKTQIYVNEQFKRSASMEQFPDESHYLPMTPKRMEFGHGAEIFTLGLNESTADEESPYVEMSKFLQDEEAKTNYEDMCIGKCYSATGSKYSDKIKLNEPVYMELPGAKNSTTNSTKESIKSEQLNTSTGKSILKKCKKGGDSLKKKVKKTSERVQNKRKDLPDILKPPQSSINVSSDSSDADDESSKQIDLKKLRSRTRFSLSDTFRPASYYLGASTTLNNCAESSDSEIVSPPPIPASPPPIEELKTEEIFSSENYDTVKRRDSSISSKMDLSCGQLPKMHSSNISLNLSKSESTLKCSRLSLPDKLSKNRYTTFKAPKVVLLKHHERTLSDSNYSFHTDNSSNTSSDFDLYNKLRQTTPSFESKPIRYQSNTSLPHKYMSSAVPIMALGDSSEAESVELRNIQTSDSELEKQRSRRPISRESIEAIELFNEQFEERMTHDLDTYLDNLQTSDLQLYQNSGFETRVAASGITNLIKPPEIFRNKDDEKFYGDINFASSLDSLPKGEYEEKHELNISTNDQTPTSTDHEQGIFYTPMHSRNNSNLSEQSAPYYYSQLSSSRVATPTTLNNQRDIHAHGCNIKHIHNPIEKICKSVEMFAEKYQTVDNKNLFKSNIEKLTYCQGKNLKTNDPQHAHNTSNMCHKQQLVNPPIKMSNFHTNKQNHAILPDFPSHMHLTSTQTAHNKEEGLNGSKITNLEMIQVEHLGGGGLDKGDQIKSEAIGKLSRSDTTKEMCNVEKTSNASKMSSFLGVQNNGERLWEEDTLWRESLRKVSQRHAKSLDDLDCIAPTYSVKKDSLKTKITRDVTYVNDHVSQHMRANINKPLTEKNAVTVDLQKTSTSIKDEDDQLSANDVYVQLMQQRIKNVEEAKADDLYEILREDTSSTMSHKSAEIDRETIRQWDAMSSGITTKNVPSSSSSNNNTEISIDSNSEQSVALSLSVQAIVQQLNAKNPEKKPSKPKQ